MNSLSVSNHNSSPSKSSPQKLFPTSNRRQLWHIVERSLLLATLMAIGLCLSKKPMQASFPVASAAAITSEINRRRNKSSQERTRSYKATIDLQQQIIAQNSHKFDSLYDNQQQQNKDFKNIKQCFQQLQGELEIITENSSQLNQKIEEKNLDRTRLTHTIRKNHQLQRQLKKLELGTIDSLSRETEELKQQLDQIAQTIAVRHKQTAKANAALNSPTSQSSNKGISRAKIPHRPADCRVVILIDEANLHITAREQGCKIDFAKLFSVLKDRSTNCKAIAYIATDPQNKKQPAFLSRLKRKGFQIVSKPVVKRANGSVKGNLDLEIGLDLVNLVNSYDTAVLVSGDADFVCAVNQSRSCGKRVEVASFRSNTSKLLIKAADSYLNLETVLEQIC